MSNNSFLSTVPIPQSSGLVLQSSAPSTVSWSPVSALSDATTVNAGSNIVVTNNLNNNVTVATAATVSFQSLTAQSVTFGTYQMPGAPGSAGQVLTVPPVGTQLEWTDPGGSGGSIVAGANIVVTEGPLGTSVALATNISCGAIETQNFEMLDSDGSIAYSLPTVVGTPGQVLSVPPVGTALEWTDPGGSGGSIVAGANITVTESPSGTSTIALDDEITIQSLTVTDDFGHQLYSLPVNDPAPNSVLVYEAADIGSNATWSNSLTVNGLTIETVNGALSFPTTQPDVGGPGMVLTQTLTGMAFKPTILELSEGPNISITQPTAGSYEIGVSSSLTLESPTDPDALMTISFNELNLSSTQNTIRLTPGSITLTNDTTGAVLFETNNNGIYTSELTLTSPAGSTIYSLPTSLGSAGQVLAVPPVGSALEWLTVSSEPGGGNVVGTPDQITATTVGNTTTVALAANISNVTSISLGSGCIISDTGLHLDPIGLNYFTDTGLRTSSISLTTQSGPSSSIIYTMPATLGTAGQVLSVPPVGTALEWMDPGGSSSIIGGANITVTEGPSGTSIALDTNISVQAITVGASSPYIMPGSIGAPNQVLAVPGTGAQLVWATVQGGGGTNSVVGTPLQVIVTTIGGTSTVSLAPSIYVDEIILGNTSKLKDTSLAFDINNEFGNNGIYASNFFMSGSSGNIIYSLPTALGGPSQVLSVPATGTALEWSSLPPASGNIVAGANIVVTEGPSGTSTSVALATNITVQSVSTPNYSLTPNAAPPLEKSVIMYQGSAPPVFGLFPDTLVSGANITLVSNGNNTTTIELNEQITLAAAAATCVINPNSITLSESTTTGCTLTQNGISTASLALTGSSGTTIYSFPTSLGSAGQVLSVAGTGTALVWETVTAPPAPGGSIVGGSGIAVSEVENVTTISFANQVPDSLFTSSNNGTLLMMPKYYAGGNIVINESEIGLAQDLAISGLTIGGSSGTYQMPSYVGTANQVLAVAASGTGPLIWTDIALPNISSQFIYEPTISGPVLTLAPNLSLGAGSTLTVTGLSGGSYSALNAETLTFDDVNSIGSTGVFTSSLTFVSPLGGTLFDFPTELGAPGQVLSVAGTGANIEWGTPSSTFTGLTVEATATDIITLGFLPDADTVGIEITNGADVSMLNAGILRVREIQCSVEGQIMYSLPMVSPVAGDTLKCLIDGALTWDQSLASYSQASDVSLVSPSGNNVPIVHMNNPSIFNPTFTATTQSYRHTLSLNSTVAGTATIQYSLYDMGLPYGNTVSSTLYLQPPVVADGYYLQAQFTDIDPRFIPKSIYEYVFTQEVPYELDLGVLPATLRTSSVPGGPAYESLFLVDTSGKLGEYSSGNLPISAYFIKQSAIAVTIFIRIYYPQIKYQTDNLVTNTSQFGNGADTNSFSNSSQPYFYIEPSRALSGVIPDHLVKPYTVTFAY